MNAQSNPRTARVPRGVRVFSRVLQYLMTAGIPVGLNRLITVRGRKSGLPRTTPLAIIEVGGRRWVWAPWGEVHWVKNLRAAGRATITKRGRREDVTATELDPTQRVEFFRDVLGPKARSYPLGVWFIRIVDGVDLNHPAEAAEGRRVFELHPLLRNASPAREDSSERTTSHRVPKRGSSMYRTGISERGVTIRVLAVQ